MRYLVMTASSPSLQNVAPERTASSPSLQNEQLVLIEPLAS